VRELGLDPYPIHFEIVPATILYEFGAYLLPGLLFNCRQELENEAATSTVVQVAASVLPRLNGSACPNGGRDRGVPILRGTVIRAQVLGAPSRDL